MATAQQNLVSGLYAKLVSDTTAGSVYALTSGRIYEGEPPEPTAGLDALMPCAIFSIISDPPDTTFTKNGIHATFQLDIWNNKAAGSLAVRNISDVAWTLLHHKQITATGLTTPIVACRDRGRLTVEGEYYRHTSEWEIIAGEA